MVRLIRYRWSHDLRKGIGMSVSASEILAWAKQASDNNEYIHDRQYYLAATALKEATDIIKNMLEKDDGKSYNEARKLLELMEKNCGRY
jgi:hypothetical protein